MTVGLMRPVFPYSWTYLALAKHYRGQHDAEFWQAYDPTLTLIVYCAQSQKKPNEINGLTWIFRQIPRYIDS